MSDPTPIVPPTETRIIPLYDHIMVVRDQATQKVGGIIIPEQAKEPPNTGQVISTGEGRLCLSQVIVEGGGADNRDLLCKAHVEPLRVQVGDKVLFQSYAGTQIKIPGTDVEALIMREDDVIAIILERPAIDTTDVAAADCADPAPDPSI